MNPLPSQSCGTQSKIYNAPNVFCKKSSTPSAHRNRKVKTKEKEEARKSVESFSTVGRERFQKKKIVRGTEKFTASVNDPVVRRSQRIASLFSNKHLGNVNAKVMCNDESSNEDSRVTKSCTPKLATAHAERSPDSPIAVPRPPLSFPNSSINFSDLIGDESPIFILKTPNCVPLRLDGLTKPGTSSSRIEVQKCKMGDLPEGQIGKLQVLKSNRLRLVLGECAFSLNRGVRVPFKEELAFVNANPETRTGEIVNLGDIKDKIIAVPESVTTFKSPDSVTT